MRKFVKQNFVVTAAASIIAAAISAPAFAQSGTGSMNPAPAGAPVQQTQQPPAGQQPPTQQQAPLPPVAPVTQAPAAQAPSTPPVPHVEFKTPGPRVDMTIEQAVQLGMKNNINIGVARLTPRLDDFSIVGLEASYKPNVTSSGSEQQATNLPRQTIQGIGTATVAGTQQWTAGLAQNIWWGGGNYTVNWTNSRLNEQATINLRNPQFQSGLTASFTQPILRGFRIDATRAAILTNRLQEDSDQVGLTTATEQTEDSIRDAYWNLVFAIQSVDVAQSTLDISNTLVTQNQQKVEIGTLAPLDVTTAKAQAASDQLSLVQAQASVLTAEIALKQLIVGGTDDPIWKSSLNPVDRPTVEAQPIDVDQAIGRAMRERTDLKQTIDTLKSSNINLENQVDQVRPQLNLTASYGLTGLGGPILESVKDPITGIVSTQIATPSGYSDALQNILHLDAPTWTIGFTFAYPLGMSTAQATVERTKLSLEQSQANVKQLQLQIAADVTSSAQTVQSSLQSVQAATSARQLAKDELDAEQAKYDVGMATQYEIQQAQRDYASAQNSELSAIRTYRESLVAFEASQTIGSKNVTGGVTSTAAPSLTSSVTTTTTSTTSTTPTTTTTTGTTTTGAPGGGGL